LRQIALRRGAQAVAGGEAVEVGVQVQGRSAGVGGAAAGLTAPW
jgi:hypothetical protein